MEIFVPGYRIVDKLGEGGMGVVYQARRPEGGHFVALKILPRHLVSDDEAKGRFLREAILVSTVDHPNICRLLESGETPSGELYFVMEFCPGRTLERWLQREQPPIDRALDVAIQTTRGLSAAHGKGIVHRDVKPSNLMVSRDGVVKILDFGLARFLPAAPIGRSGTVLGSIPYAAPEQLLGGEIDHRVDIWALGVVLYEMVTGFLPFRGGDRRRTIDAILKQEPESLRRLRPDAPAELEGIVARALEKEPRRRYPTAEDFRAALERLAGEPVGERSGG